jgi:hypothetical protein
MSAIAAPAAERSKRKSKSAPTTDWQTHIQSVEQRLAGALKTVCAVLEASDPGSHFHMLLNLASSPIGQALQEVRTQPLTTYQTDAAYEGLFAALACLCGAQALAGDEAEGIFAAPLAAAYVEIDLAQTALDSATVGPLLPKAPVINEPEVGEGALADGPMTLDIDETLFDISAAMNITVAVAMSRAEHLDDEAYEAALELLKSADSATHRAAIICQKNQADARDTCEEASRSMSLANAVLGLVNDRVDDLVVHGAISLLNDAKDRIDSVVEKMTNGRPI